MRIERHFADVSSNNGTINVGGYARTGYPLLAVKATEGETYRNPFHEEQVRRAHALGLPVLHYHFARPVDPMRVDGEVGAFWSTVRPLMGAHDYVCLDLEVTGGLSWSQVVTYARHFDKRLHEISGHELVLYTYSSFLASAGPNLTCLSRRFWIANYGGVVGRLGNHRRRWAIQYTDGKTGGDPKTFVGIGPCDGSRLNLRSSLHLKLVRARHRNVRG